MSNLAEKYELKQELGRGAFSVVYLGVSKTTGEKFAIKSIDKKQSGNDAKNLAMEIDILKKVKHPNIISLHDLIDTEDYLYLVMELVTGGELFDKIVERGSYTEAEASQVIAKVIDAIGYLHSQNIIHRDLKPENLLLKSAENDIEVAIADFGLSKISSAPTFTACGTPSYVAPEVLRAEGYDKNVDMWSIGVITYIILCGFPPFYGDSVAEIFDQILSGKFDYPSPYWDDISNEAKDFINQLLTIESGQRLTAEQALAHPWLRGAARSLQLKSQSAERFRDFVAREKSYRSSRQLQS